MKFSIAIVSLILSCAYAAVTKEEAALAWGGIGTVLGTAGLITGAVGLSEAEKAKGQASDVQDQVQMLKAPPKISTASYSYVAPAPVPPVITQPVSSPPQVIQAPSNPPEVVPALF